MNSYCRQVQSDPYYCTTSLWVDPCPIDCLYALCNNGEQDSLFITRQNYDNKSECVQHCGHYMSAPLKHPNSEKHLLSCVWKHVQEAHIRRRVWSAIYKLEQKSRWKGGHSFHHIALNTEDLSLPKWCDKR
jgi:hypothetical protein